MRRLWQDNHGLTILEYALLLGVIFLAGLVTWQRLGSPFTNVFDNTVIEQEAPDAD